MGDARVAAAAKAIAYRLDPHAVVERAANAENERTVTIRPAPDTMTYLTALLPVAQGVSVYAALRRAADTCCDGRSRGQVMADTLVERVTGRAATVPTPIAVNLVLSDETLLGGHTAPADIGGYGPIPAAVARAMVCGAVTDRRSRATLRRLYAHPRSGALVAMESRARRFPRGLAAFIELRDQRCRTPYCDAPIRHRDHAQPWAEGGPDHRDQRARVLRVLQLRQGSRTAGGSAPASMKTTRTQLNSPPRRAIATGRGPHRAHRRSPSASSRSESASRSLGTPPSADETGSGRRPAGEVLDVDDFTAIDADPIAPIEVRTQTPADELNIGRAFGPLKFVDVRQLSHAGDDTPQLQGVRPGRRVNQYRPKQALPNRKSVGTPYPPASTTR